MQFEYFSHNGSIRPVDQAVVPLSSIEYSYGFGVYETIRVNASVPYFLDDHIERLMESARIIELQHEFTPAMIAESVQALTACTPPAGGSPAFNLKILLIGGKGASEASLYILCLNPLFPDKRMYRDGVKVISVQHERNFPHAKTLSMLGSYLAYERARAQDAYDALLVDREGNILEGTRTNFFVIKDRTIISPPDEKILLGVTRKVVLKVAAANGFSVEQRDIPLTSLGEYDAAFLTSTSSNIMPIREIDGSALSVTAAPLRSLMAAFDGYLRESRGLL